uniref:Anaphase-promoting complex subunit 4 n=1 Tax=Picocystis salinarum TaxID=88271 RepID=A0A7S3UE54_9CHLO
MAMDEADDGGGSFSVLVEKKTWKVVERTEWSPAMDLLAVLTQDGQLTLHRLNWQKLWTAAFEASAVDICWKPNGKAIAVGHVNGNVSILDVENGDLLKTLRLHQAPVVRLRWTWLMGKQGVLPTEEYVDRLHDVLGEPIVPLPNQQSGGGIHDSNRKGKRDGAVWPDPEETMNVLCSCDRDGHVALSAFGVVKIAHWCIDDRNSTEERKLGEILKIELAKNGTKLVTVYGVKDPTECGKEHIRAELMDLHILNGKMKEIHQVALFSARVGMLMEYVAQSVEAARKSWKDLMDSFEKKIKKQLVVCLQDDGSMNSTYEELLSLLACGAPSRAMEQFLLVMPGESGLKRIAKQAEAACADVHAILAKRAYPNLRMVLYLLEDLLGLSRCINRIDVLGVDEHCVLKALDLVTLLLLQVQRVVDAIETVQGQYQLFFKWLNSVILMHAEDRGERKVGEEAEAVSLMEMDRIVQFLGLQYNEDCISPHLSRSHCRHVRWPIPYPDWRDSHLSKKVRALLHLDFSDDRYSLDVPLAHLFAYVEESLGVVFAGPLDCLSRSFKRSASLPLGETIHPALPCVDVQNHADGFLIALSEPQFCLRLIHLTGSSTVPALGARLSMGASSELVDLMFYKDSVLALLFNGKGASESKLVLLDCEEVDLHDWEDSRIQALPWSCRQRVFPHLSSQPLAVMGTRGVGCLVFGGKRVVLLDMEEDEGGEEEEVEE